MLTSKTFHLSTVVWGQWHTGVFLDVNLPSLLASGNLEAFAKLHNATYFIQTSRADAGRIEASPAFQQLRQIVKCKVLRRTIYRAIDPITLHHLLWRQSIDQARRAGAMVLFVPPDVVWSNDSFGHIAELAAAGKKAIFMTYLRVVSETAVPDVRRLFEDRSTGIIDAPGRALVQVAMRHIHPLTLTYVRDSPNFPMHPEFILWPVEGEGYLMRVLVREMFAYDPRCFDLNRQALLAHRPDPADAHYITDSDNLFSLSLAPLTKDVEWYATPQRLDPLQVGAWWLRYDSPSNDIVSRHYFHIHQGERTPDKWRDAELQSDAVIRRIAGTREGLRVLSALAGRDLAYAEQVVGAALVEAKLARFIGPGGAPVTILLPGAAETYSELFDDEVRASPARVARRFVDLLLGHVVVGQLSLVRGREATLVTPLGSERHLTWRDDVPLIDGVELEQPGFALGPHWCYPTARALPRVKGSRPPRSPAARNTVEHHSGRDAPTRAV